MATPLIPPPQFRHGTGGEGNILKPSASVVFTASAQKAFGPTDLTSAYSGCTLRSQKLSPGVIPSDLFEKRPTTRFGKLTPTELANLRRARIRFQNLQKSFIDSDHAEGAEEKRISLFQRYKGREECRPAFITGTFLPSQAHKMTSALAKNYSKHTNEGKKETR
ncbi:hypothetical protein TNCV_3008091 [Trichonephila clavipes]|nr:hypothetical protein TNCV_3008091 [Trichonephila clavipes]